MRIEEKKSKKHKLRFVKIEKRLYIVATGKGMKDFMEEIGSPCELQEVVGRDFDI